MVDKRRTYLIQDPYDDDAVRFIGTIFAYFGLRPVCFYTDEKQRFYRERDYPILGSRQIEASYDVPLDELEEFSRMVRERYEVLGVIPYREDTVEAAAELCERLDLDWNPAETLRRFRDKYALKTHVHAQDQSVRVPGCRLIEHADDLWRGPLPERLVLKPNDGFGNQHVGIFEAGEREAMLGHVNAHPETTWILEEYIPGTEFHVDGQIRSGGEVEILGVFQYLRGKINGYPTVYLGEIQCRSDHPLFGSISDYARRLMTASGLERCPFHMEVKVDEHGPCVIDLGARLPSDGSGCTLSRVHPERPDVYAVAAHDYLGSNTFARGPVDYTFYDSELAVVAYGVSTRDEIIHTLSGIETVEAMPGFVSWVVKPQIGDRVPVTTDLRTAPYIVELRQRGDDGDPERLIEQVQRTVRWNEQSDTGAWLRARAEHVVRRAGPKLRWLAHNLAAPRR